MRTLLILLAVVFGLSFAQSTASASDYVYRNGYYWSNGVAYSRVPYRYYANGCWYTSYRYVAVNTGSSGSDSYSDEGWRARLLDIVKRRDAWEGANRRSAVEHAEFIETVEKLGLSGNFSISGYGQSVPYAKYGVANYYPQGYVQYPANTGAVAAGYSQVTVTDAYSNVDLNSLANMATRLASDQQGYAAEAVAGANQLIDNVGARAGAIAEINAKKEAVVAAAQAFNAANQSTKVELKVGSGAQIDPNANIADQGKNLQRLQAIMTNNCVSCHKPGSQVTKMDLTDVSKLSATDLLEIDARVNTHDIDKRMPKAADGGAAPPLNEKDRRFITWMTGNPYDSN